MQARVSGSDTSDAVRLLGLYEDTDNYVFMEVYTTDPATYKLYQRKGGTDSQIGFTQTITGKNHGDTILCKMCMYNNTLYGEALSTGGSVVASGALDTSPAFYYGRYEGLATGSMTGTATFDDFSAQVNRNSRSTCDQCNACDSGSFADTFSADSFGWDNAYTSYVISGGRMVYAAGGSGLTNNNRCHVLPTLAVGTKIALSVAVWDTTNTATVGIRMNYTSADEFRLFARPPFGNYSYNAGATTGTIAVTPANGDVLAIEATCSQVSPQKWDVAWKINGTTEATASALSLTILDPFYYGITNTPSAFPTQQEWDDFALDIT